MHRSNRTAFPAGHIAQRPRQEWPLRCPLGVHELAINDRKYECGTRQKPAPVYMWSMGCQPTSCVARGRKCQGGNRRVAQHICFRVFAWVPAIIYVEGYHKFAADFRVGKARQYMTSWVFRWEPGAASLAASADSRRNFRARRKSSMSRVRSQAYGWP